MRARRGETLGARRGRARWATARGGRGAGPSGPSMNSISYLCYFIDSSFCPFSPWALFDSRSSGSESRLSSRYRGRTGGRPTVGPGAGAGRAAGAGPLTRGRRPGRGRAVRGGVRAGGALSSPLPGGALSTTPAGRGACVDLPARRVRNWEDGSDGARRVAPPHAPWARSAPSDPSTDKTPGQGVPRVGAPCGQGSPGLAGPETGAPELILGLEATSGHSWGCGTTLGYLVLGTRGTSIQSWSQETPRGSSEKTGYPRQASPWGRGHPETFSPAEHPPSSHPWGQGVPRVLLE